jgi:membrane protein required for colicin V production
MLGVVLLAKIGAKIIEKSLQLVMLGWLNKLAGIFLFASLYIIILSIVLFYFDRLGFIKPETFATSKSYFLIKPWAPKFIEILGDTKHFF